MERDEWVEQPLQRRDNGAIDVDYYRARAERLRAEAFAHAIRQSGRWVAQLAVKISRWFGDYRQRQRTARELLALDAHALRDIGISRGDIDAVVRGEFASDATRHSRLQPLADRNSTPAAISWVNRDRPGVRSGSAADSTVTKRYA
jgi:uncharacterized protein YjiS (DUF1127 family)